MAAKGWFLDADRLSPQAVETIERTIRRAKHAHETDVVMRINGAEQREQADWVKYMTPAGAP